MLPHFHIILIGQFIFEINLFIQSHHQGQRLISKSSKRKYHFLTNKDKNCVIAFLRGILAENSNYDIILVI